MHNALESYVLTSFFSELTSLTITEITPNLARSSHLHGVWLLLISLTPSAIWFQHAISVQPILEKHCKVQQIRMSFPPEQPQSLVRCISRQNNKKLIGYFKTRVSPNVASIFVWGCYFHFSHSRRQPVFLGNIIWKGRGVQYWTVEGVVRQLKPAHGGSKFWRAQRLM